MTEENNNMMEDQGYMMENYGCIKQNSMTSHKCMKWQNYELYFEGWPTIHIFINFDLFDFVRDDLLRALSVNGRGRYTQL